MNTLSTCDVLISWQIHSYKISPRAVNAHAYVNAVFRFEVNTTADFQIIGKPFILYGGINPDFVSMSLISMNYINDLLIYIQLNLTSMDTWVNGCWMQWTKSVQTNFLWESQDSARYLFGSPYWLMTSLQMIVTADDMSALHVFFFVIIFLILGRFHDWFFYAIAALHYQSTKIIFCLSDPCQTDRRVPHWPVPAAAWPGSGGSICAEFWDTPW